MEDLMKETLRILEVYVMAFLMQPRLLRFGLLLAIVVSVPNVRAERHTLSLNGGWQIEESVEAEAMPLAFTHRVQVPGLANLAKPAFPGVDDFYSREFIANRTRSKIFPEAWRTNYWLGKLNQDRNYFWYRRTFKAPAARAVALLKINKAQFGTVVWLNGQKVGEHAGCFTAGYFHLEKSIQWGAENTLVVRIGAHPAVLPDTYPTGTDFEKIKWTPGIYDDVSLILCDNPLITSVQVAPRLKTSEVVVQTVVENTGPETTFELRQRVSTWKGRRSVSVTAPETLKLKAGESRTITQTIPVPDAHLWSPEDPFLYAVDTSTGGDSVTTRFGMREFRFDSATRRAYLNGKVYYLRGSNITLHRFLEDPLCKDLPWKEAWVRELLGDLPKKMHWNYFRFCIGPVPDRWLDICDEVGLLIQNEFFVWTGGPGWYPGYSRSYDAEEMVRQYKEWMRDNWNHPSVAVWDANNETKDDIFGKQIIPAVRPLDLSNRPWENSYNPPAGPDDPVEDHPYLMSGGHFAKLSFKMSDLETMDGKPKPGRLPSDTHAPIINEYGWLWLNRDGSPTVLTEKVYAQLMGTNVTATERLAMYSYLLAGKTEFWRAHRHYAGIIHFVYLTCSYPMVYTADHFADVKRLRLEPHFADYMSEAFKPLGVYINFFQPTLQGGASREFTVMMVNDRLEAASGQLALTLETKQGRVLTRAQVPFSMAGLGDQQLKVTLPVVGQPGDCVLSAVARTDQKNPDGPTVSRRWVKIQ
jgi:beta-galactosidase